MIWPSSSKTEVRQIRAFQNRIQQTGEDLETEEIRTAPELVHLPCLHLLHFCMIFFRVLNAISTEQEAVSASASSFKDHCHWD